MSKVVTVLMQWRVDRVSNRPKVHQHQLLKRFVSLTIGESAPMEPDVFSITAVESVVRGGMVHLIVGELSVGII